MKILIGYCQQEDILPFLEKIGNAPFAISYTHKHIQIDFVKLGHTCFETAFAMGKALQKERYHLVLLAGFASSLNKFMKIGDVVNVINDQAADLGYENNEGIQNFYELGYLNKIEHPHQRGGFINMSSAYFNVFLPFMKTAAITSSIIGGNLEKKATKMERFPMHIETSNGIAFQYACLHVGVPFYQLRAIQSNWTDNSDNKALALENLNNSLYQIIELL